MDAGAFVQENRRWLIGAAAGGLCVLIAWNVIAAVWSPDAVQGQMLGLLRSNKETQLFGRPVLDAARTEQEQLAAEKQRLQQELAFVPSPQYQLAAGGAADQRLFQVGSELKERILAGGQDRDVQVVEKDVSWPQPTTVDEIRSLLFALELIDECCQRLFAAHDAVRRQDPEAAGLRTILALKSEPRSGSRPTLRGGRPGEVDLRDHVVQERVQFRFAADAATITAFFEACRKPGRTLALDGVQMQGPERAGDPVTVTGTLVGIAWKEK